MCIRDRRTITSIGILEEVRYYARQTYATPGDDTSESTSRLSMARFYPGTQVAYAGDDENFQIDIADNILDLQLAMAIDIDGDGQIVEDGSEDDDWLFNSPDDDPTEAKWNGGALPALFYLRATTLARTDRRDIAYIDGPITVLEDHDYSEVEIPADADEKRDRMYRRRTATTVIDLRNVL